MANPFDTEDCTERRLRFDVLQLAYRIVNDGIVDTRNKTVVDIAEGLMEFVNGQAVSV